MPSTPRLAVLVNGLPGSGKSTLAPRLSRALGLPLFSKDVFKETFADHLPAHVVREFSAAHGRVGPGLGAGASETQWSLLADSPLGAVLESYWRHNAIDFVRAGAERAGFEPSQLIEVYCRVPGELAKARFEQRSARRHPVHGPQVDLPCWPQIIAEADPLALGPAIEIDTTGPVSDEEVLVLADRVRAASRIGGDAVPGREEHRSRT